MAFGPEDVREILRLVDESGLDELRIETEGLSLHVRKGPPSGMQPIPVDGAAATGAPPAEASASPPAPAAPATPAPDGLPVEAPMLGTFYRAEGPGQPPLVEVGDRVEPDTVVCLIEVMKLMNHIQAGVSGVVTDVLADDGTLVEFGQPLLLVASSA